LLSILPIIPIQVAPVIPNQIYHLSFIPLVLLIWQVAAPMLGVSYRWEWYTTVTVIALPTISLLAAVISSRSILGKPKM
jgi:hypothetical protein